MKYRIPRKQKKKIPYGPYCYNFKVINMETLDFETKYCPFHQYIKAKDKPEKYQDEIDKEYPEEYVEFCGLVKYEIMDSCKSCSSRKGY